MPQEYIEIRGARENNLKNVSLRIPKRVMHRLVDAANTVIVIELAW